MADLPPDADSPGGTRDIGTAAGDRRPGTPRWVKVFGIIALAAVVLVVILLLAGGNHGPSRHSSSGDGAAQTPPSSVSRSEDAGRKPPAVGHQT